MIRVLVLEPDQWRYRGLKHAMTEYGEIEVIGDPDYGKILALSVAPADLKPNVIFIAHRLVLEYGLSMIPLMREVFSPAGVLVHGEVDSLDIAAEVFAAGARGYFVLEQPPAQLVSAITVVSKGKYWGKREAVALMADRLTAKRADEVQPVTPLNEEDWQLLRLLNEGLSNKEIGQRLGLAEATIKARFNRLYKHFGVATRLQLLTTAIRQGLIHPTQPTRNTA